LFSSRFLDIREDRSSFSFCMQRCFDESLALRMRDSESRRRVRQRLKSVGDIAVSPAGVTIRVAPRDGVGLSAIAPVTEQIDRDLSAIAARTMTSHEVQEALRISARERIRWTKNNRLRTCGTITVRRQQVVTLNTYAPDYIERLYRRPGNHRRVADGRSSR